MPQQRPPSAESAQLPIVNGDDAVADAPPPAPAAPAKMNASLAYLRELVDSCRAHIRPPSLPPAILADIQQTAESLEEVRSAAAAEPAVKAIRGEDGAGDAAALPTSAEPCASASVASDSAALERQLRRLQLFRHRAMFFTDEEKAVPITPRAVGTEKIAGDVLCATALLQGSVDGALKTDEEHAELVGEVVSAVCESNGLDRSGPAAAVWRAEVVRFVNMARGFARVEWSTKEIETAAKRAESQRAESEKVKAAAKPALTASAAGTKPDTKTCAGVLPDLAPPKGTPSPTPAESSKPAPKAVDQAFAKDWAAKAHSPDTTGLTPTEARLVMSHFKVKHLHGKARFRVFMEAMRTARPGLSQHLPEDERQWFRKCPIDNIAAYSALELPSVNTVHPELTPEWNVGAVLLALLPLKQAPCVNMLKNGKFSTMYRVLATNLQGEPCFVSLACVSPAAAVARFVADAPETMTSPAVSPVFIAARELSGCHARILAPTNSCTPEQAELIERLHAPAARLATRAMSFTCVTVPPKTMFGADAVHRDAVLAVACIAAAALATRGGAPRKR